MRRSCISGSAGAVATLTLNHVTVEIIFSLNDLEDFISRNNLQDSLVKRLFYLCHINLQLIDFLYGFGISLRIIFNILLQIVNLFAHFPLFSTHLIVWREECARFLRS